MAPSPDHAICYTGVVLDEPSRDRLLTRVGGMIPEGYRRIGHHMTINLGPLDPALNPASVLGRAVALRAVSWGLDGRVLAVGVEAPVRSTNPRPHVTVACNYDAGGEPRHSNELAEWRPLPEPFELTRVVQEVPLPPPPRGDAG